MDETWDVVVAGAGAAGFAASIAAARNGAKTLLVEKRGFVGGTLASGLPILGFHNNRHEQVVRGIADELVQRLVAEGGSPGFELLPLWQNSQCATEPAILKCVVQDMLTEAGVSVLLHAQVVDIDKEGAGVRSLTLQKKSGRQDLRARVVVEAAGDAELAYMAGAPVQKGHERFQYMQPPTLLFRMVNVDFDELRGYLKEHPASFVDWRFRPGEKATPEFLESTGNFLAFPELLEEAQRRGEWTPLIDRVMFTKFPNGRDVLINMLRGFRVDGTQSESMTEAVFELRRNLPKLVAFLQNRVPGFRDAYVVDADPEVLLRETRRIVGEYVLTVDDVMAGRQFEDSIAVGGYYVDVHNPDDPHASSVLTDHPYGIPYRCLIPKGVDNMLAAGRCISGTHEAAGSYRVMATCMATGQAAGTAAALAAADGVTTGDVDVERLRALLRSQGAVVEWPRGSLVPSAQ